MTTTLPEPFTVNGRYEITERPMGEGGMGVIYKAYDVVTKRFVALKTLWADATAETIDLFEREWTVLARLSHPNIVDILDTGDWVFQGERRPYFVMPLLPGRTLEEIIKTASERLTVERTVDIISQACRGLQAAHDQSLIHRDIKPSNIFVMEDDTVKIIDFGVVHLADGHSAVTGLKGTPVYMAPEQLEMKPATPLSDIFSLATVCYETLTGRKPFARPTSAEVAEAIRSYIPPAASEINPAVNQLVSRTVHKAMAKQPWHRFSNAREFGDTLQKALRNEPIERFERAKILPRIERVKKAYSEGDYQFALEILRELESEGHVDPDMSVLHIQIEQALRQKNIRQLLENARIRMEEEEFPLALHKVEDALALDPANMDAQTLKEQIERRRDENQLTHWFRVVREQLDHNLFRQARQGLQEILKIDSSNTEAREMLAAIDQTEQEIVKSREEKQRLYESAVDAYRNGEISSALTQLERALAIARRSAHSSSPDLDAQCQSFHDSIRGERDTAHKAYQEGRHLLQSRNVAQALEICEEYLRKHPDDPRFQALKLEAEEVQREDQSAAIAEVSRQVDAEPDLDQKHKILQDAVAAHPAEPHFRSALKLIADRRDLVNSIVSRARQYEDRGQFGDAAGQLDILRNIYPLFPGLDAEMQRLARRKEEQALLESKAVWLEQIDGHLHAAEYDKALADFSEAEAAFPADSDLLQRKALAEQGVARNAEATVLLKEGQDFCAARNFQDGLASLRKAERLDPRNRLARAALLSGLVSHARELMPSDWHAAEPLVKEALDLEPSDPVARSLLAVLDDNRRQTAINIILAGARNYQTDGHLADALQIVERGLEQYPNDHRLIPYFNSLRAQAGQPLTPAMRRKPPTPVFVQPESAVSGGPDSALLPQSVPAVAANPPEEAAAPTASAAVTVVPHQIFFPPPTTDIPPREPAAEPSANQQTLAATPRRERPRVPPVRPPRPHDPGLLSELSFRGPIWGIAALSALTLILCAGLYQFLTKPTASSPVTLKTPDARTKRALNPVAETAPPALVTVSFASNVPGTRFDEDGQPLNATAQLSVGSHNIEAFHEGYLAEMKSLTIEGGATAPLAVQFELRPILPQIRLSSSIGRGRLVLDQAESLNLQAGVASKEDLALGPHTVKVYDGRRLVFSFTFEAKANSLPVLLTPLGNQPVAGAVVASLAGAAKVYTTAGLRAGVALPAVAAVSPIGLTVNGSATNPAHFLLDTGKGRGPQEQSVDPSTFPTLTVHLAGAPPEAPTLLISSSVLPTCQILLDGKPLNRLFQGKSLSLPVEVGSHPVHLSCPGYKDMEQVAVVKAGDSGVHKLDFAMLPNPVAVATPVRRATFTLSGAPPDTPVFQNQIRIGTVGSDGTFAREIEPGTFTWEWRKPGYEPRKETRSVRAGESLHFDGAMTPSSGSLTLKVLPEFAHISVRREADNALLNVPNNTPFPLPPGSYKVTAQAADYRDRSESVLIGSGKPLTLAWDLEKLPVLSGPLRFFENGEDWKPFPGADGWWIHPGSGYSSLRSSSGAVSIDFLRKKRSRKINMLADCQDHGNCIVYTIDAHNLLVKVVAGGVTMLDDKKPHGMDENSSFHLVFEMSPASIIVKNRAGTVLSSVERKNPPGKLAIQDDNPLNIN